MAEFHPSDSDVLGLKYSLAGAGAGAGAEGGGGEGSLKAPQAILIYCQLYYNIH